MSIRSSVMDQIMQVVREHGKTLTPLNDELVLLDSGFDSLSIAVLIARLEDTLGFDPFRVSEDGQLPWTVGDFDQDL